MIWHAFQAEFRRIFIEFRRYPTEFISSAAIMIILFYGLFLGAAYISGNSVFGNRLSDIVVSYALFSLLLTVIGDMGWSISNEAQNGTLEQLYLNRVSAKTVLFLRLIANLLINLGMTLIVLLVITYLTGRNLHFSWLDIVPLILSSIAASGLGYLVASITIIFKRTNNFLNLLQFIFLFMVMTPFTQLPGVEKNIAIIIPLAPMIGLLKQMMINHLPLFTHGDWLFWSLINASLWLTIGMLVFLRASTYARRKGMLGHY